MLTTIDHRRDRAGLTYVYPVLSRRSGGISIGINLNINNACNWRCVYCQVPDLICGSAPPVNLEKLENELRYFLNEVIYGDFYEREQVNDELRMIKDIAISGNGEPTTAKDFDQVVSLLKLVLEEYALVNDIKSVLITNGSMSSRTHVQKGLATLSMMNGEVWFKIDSATSTGMARINQICTSNTAIVKKLKITAELCPTWIQSCFFAFDDTPPSEEEVSTYIDFLDAIASKGIPIRGIHLYGVERPSMQRESNRITKLTDTWFNEMAKRLRDMPFMISVHS